MLDGHFREGGLCFNFSIASIKLNHGDIFSFPNKLKFDAGTRIFFIRNLASVLVP